MGELAVFALLTVVGWGLIAAVSPHRSPTLMATMAAPVGVAAYTVSALALMVITGTLRPVSSLVVTGVAGVVLVGIGVTRTPRWWVSLGGAVAGVAVIVLASRAVHLTRVTPDSFRYLLMVADLQDPTYAAGIMPAQWWSDLLKRGFGLPSIHALAVVTDRDHLASLSPVVGVSALATFAWFLADATRGLAARYRRWLLVGVGLFVVASNRFVYDLFYVNTHIVVAAWTLIALVGAWKAVTTTDWTWAVPAGLVLATTVLMRAEAPLVALLVLVPLAATSADTRTRLAMGVPLVIVTVAWFGIVATHWHRDDPLPLTWLGSVAAGVVGGLWPVLTVRLRPLAEGVARAMVPVMVLALAVFAARDVDGFVESVRITFGNLVLGQAMWMLTWVVLVPLVAVALVSARFPVRDLWTRFVAGFGVLFWLLPFIREDPWTPGAGDSGSRILAHVFLVALAVLVLAVPAEAPSVKPEAGSLP